MNADILHSLINSVKQERQMGYRFQSYKILQISVQYMSVCVKQDANKQFILSLNCSTCFRWFFHPSSGVQITVSTASDTSQPLLLPVAIVEDSDR